MKVWSNEKKVMNASKILHYFGVSHEGLKLHIKQKNR